MKVIIRPQRTEIYEAIKVKDNIDKVIIDNDDRKQEIVKEDDKLWLVETYSGEEKIGNRTLVIENSTQKISLEESDILIRKDNFYIVPNVPAEYLVEIDKVKERAVKKMNSL